MADGETPSQQFAAPEVIAAVVASVLRGLAHKVPGLVSGHERLLTQEEAAEILGVSVKQLAEWRWKGGGPRFVRLSHKVVRYRYAALMAWAEAHEFESAHQARLSGV